MDIYLSIDPSYKSVRKWTPAFIFKLEMKELKSSHKNNTDSSKSNTRLRTKKAVNETMQLLRMPWPFSPIEGIQEYTGKCSKIIKNVFSNITNIPDCVEYKEAIKSKDSAINSHVTKPSNDHGFNYIADEIEQQAVTQMKTKMASDMFTDIVMQRLRKPNHVPLNCQRFMLAQESPVIIDILYMQIYITYFVLSTQSNTTLKTDQKYSFMKEKTIDLFSEIFYTTIENNPGSNISTHHPADTKNKLKLTFNFLYDMYDREVTNLVLHRTDAPSLNKFFCSQVMNKQHCMSIQKKNNKIIRIIKTIKDSMDLLSQEKFSENSQSSVPNSSSIVELMGTVLEQRGLQNSENPLNNATLASNIVTTSSNDISIAKSNKEIQELLEEINIMARQKIDTLQKAMEFMHTCKDDIGYYNEEEKYLKKLQAEKEDEEDDDFFVFS